MVWGKLRLEGKTAIVTGGGTGLGKVMSLAMAKAGADIVVAARRVELIEQTAAEVRRLGRRAMAIPTDVTDSGQVNRMMERVISEFGRIDILINNAGVVRAEVPKPVWEITDQEWHLGMDTNLTGTFFCCRAVGKHMVDRKRGKVINVASGFGLRGLRGIYMYCAAKAGVVLLTKSLALTWAEAGIHVNCIAPGFLPARPERYPGEKEVRGRHIPMGRIGQPREIGPLAVFLASEASDYITGEVFSVDGGSMAGGYAPTGYRPVIPISSYY